MNMKKELMRPFHIRLQLVFFVAACGFLTIATTFSKAEAKNNDEPRTLYVVEYLDTSGVIIKSISDLRPDLNRRFESGDKARWYLTKNELKTIRFRIEDDAMTRWYQIQEKKLNEWISLRLEPTYRVDELTLNGPEDLSVKVLSENAMMNGKARRFSSYPPDQEWQNVQEAQVGQPISILVRNDSTANEQLVKLRVEVPWGFEFPDGKRSSLFTLQTYPGQSNELNIHAERLPLIPLVYIDYSEAMPTNVVRDLTTILQEYDGKAFISLGHDGRIVHQIKVSGSSHENWDRLNQYLNRHPTIGYASLARNEINQFVDYVKQIQYGFWRNQFAIPILILSSRYQTSLTQTEFDRWIEQIQKLKEDKLIKDEIIVIIMGNQTNGHGLNASNYNAHFFNWSSRELKQALSELLHNLSLGKVL